MRMISREHAIRERRKESFFKMEFRCVTPASRFDSETMMLCNRLKGKREGEKERGREGERARRREGEKEGGRDADNIH